MTYCQKKPLASANRHRTVAALIGAAMVLPSYAQAQRDDPPDRQGALEEIVVTAQRREESVQEVPISITPVTAETLEASGIEAMDDLPQIVPSVQILRSGSPGIFFIRGVGNNSAGTGEEGANAVYVDGVYMTDLSQAVFDFNNIERLEVLKGPQGTLFGRNSTGGLIHVITREPGDEFEAFGTFGYGNYDTYRGKLYVGGPLSQTISADIALTGTDQNDGWGRNIVTGEDTKLGWNWGVRSKVVVHPNESVKLTLAGDYSKANDSTTTSWSLAEGALGLPGPGFPQGTTAPSGDYDTNTPHPQFRQSKVRGVSLTTEIDLEWATLTSVSAGRLNDLLSFVDVDLAEIPYVKTEIPSSTRSFQQEIRLASNNAEPLAWQGGIFYLRNKAEVSQVFRGLAFGGVDSGFDQFSEMRINSFAGFGEISYSVTPTTRVTMGLRYTHEDGSFEARQIPVGHAPDTPLFNAFNLPDRDDSMTSGEFTYRVAVQQDITDNLNLYGTYNRGYKAGLWIMQTPANPPVDPQFIDAFEIGMKSTLFNQKLRLNLSAYNYELEDLQVRALGPAQTAILLNAASVDVEGFEADFDATPWSPLRVFGGISILSSEFSDFPGALFTYPNPAVCTPTDSEPGRSIGAPSGGNTTCFGNAEGNDTPLAPKFVSTLGASFTIPAGSGEVMISGLWNYNDGYFFEPDNRLRQDSYDVVNAAIEYRSPENWGLEIWGRNLNDTRYLAQQFSGGLGDQKVYSAPRTYGISFNFRM